MLTFDAENHLIAAGGLVYKYDGDGNRVSKAPSGSPTSPNLIYWYGGSGNLQQESDGAGNGQYAHIYFNGRRIKRIEWNHGGWFDHYAYDHLGNARFVYGYNGASDVSDFYPFGGERPYTNTCTTHYKFEGKERDDETGNDDFGARYFSNRFGRWLSADWSNVPVPVPYANLTNPQTLNLYAMVADDPESVADFDGHSNVTPDWSSDEAKARRVHTANASWKENLIAFGIVATPGAAVAAPEDAINLANKILGQKNVTVFNIVQKHWWSW
ncbi:MAG: hypothetical protein JSS69_07465 [Acidobacteria bacterium]|nr:hypothetical protein [Acidobacteriota bacterium]MBS1865741.1 hypothetical protein [Acidobacteriota bacterium]